MRAGSLIFFLVLSIAHTAKLHTQNPIPNGDFENYQSCPSDMSQIESQSDWFDATNGTPDYFNSCDLSNMVSVPLNFMGSQYAHSGNAYAGIHIAQNKGTVYREFLEAKLNASLEAGKAYLLHCYVNLGDHSYCAPKNLCFYFSDEMITDFTTLGNLSPWTDFLQSLCIESGATISDSVNWVLMEYCFIATGDEAYILIGNNFTNSSGGCSTTETGIQNGYIYIDDISLADPEIQSVYFDTLMCRGDELSLDIRPFVLEPLNADLSCLWNDGNTSFVRTFYEPGNYTALLQNGCFADTVHIAVNENTDCEEIFYIPNAFSPNGDGMNDRFRIVQDNITVYRFVIYNRWGQMVFSSTNPTGWDGSRNGVMQPMGVYLYQLDYTTNISDQSKRKEGYITLIY